MGPMLGAIVMLLNMSLEFLEFLTGKCQLNYAKGTALTAVPRSAGEATSITTTYAIEVVPDGISSAIQTDAGLMPDIANACNTTPPEPYTTSTARLPHSPRHTDPT